MKSALTLLGGIAISAALVIGGAALTVRIGMWVLGW